MLPTRVLKNHLVFTPSTQTRSIFPAMKEATLDGSPIAAVPHTIEAARLLRNLGYDAHSPIRYTYDWPRKPGITPRPHQVETSDFFVLNPRAHCHNAMRCVDQETEFLTPTGWKKLPAYQEGDLVAQWNPQTDRAEFVEPLEYIKTPCTEMIHLKTTKGIDQMLTPEHRVVYWSSAGELMETTAEKVHQRGLETKGWRGLIPVTFKAPERAGISLADADIRLMVAVIADGSFPSPGTTRCRVRVKKERKKERLRGLLTAAGVAWKERSKDFPTAKGFTVFQFYAPRREKEFTAYWWGANQDQLQIVLDEAQHWDGSLSRRDEGVVRFSSYVQASSDYIQYAAICCKRGATLSAYSYSRGHDRGQETSFNVRIKTHGRPASITGVTADGQKILNSKRVGPPPDGFCYCFSVPSTYLIFRRNGCVFISGNTGKTLSVLWGIDHLQKEGLVRKALVVAPLSTLERVWGDEIFVNFPRKKFAVLYGSAEKRKKLLATEQDIYVVNHDGIEILSDELMKRPDIDLIVIDELAVYRNSRTNRWKVMNKVVNQRGFETWCWGLTGTPTPNEPTDAYGQAKLVRPEALGHQRFTSFKNEVMQQMGPFRWVVRRGAEEVVKRVLSPSIRFERSVVTEMEPCLIERHAELSPQQRTHLNELLKQATTEIDGAQITAVNAAVLVSKILQVSCGVAYDSAGGLVRFDFGPRLKVLEELIEENNGEKVIVFVPFTGALNAIAAELKKRWTVAVVDGGVPAGARNKIFQDFQNTPNPHVLVAHPGCMSHGLELTRSSLICWYSAYPSNETYQQACARIDGGGQKSKIDIAHISSTPTERKIYAAIRERQKLQTVVLSLLQNNRRIS